MSTGGDECRVKALRPWCRSGSNKLEKEVRWHLRRMGTSWLPQAPRLCDEDINYSSVALSMCSDLSPTRLLAADDVNLLAI